MPMTTDQMTLAKQLRDQGLSYARIAKQVHISESMAWKFFNPRPSKPKPKPEPKTESPKPSILPPTVYHSSSIPITRPLYQIERNRPQMSKPELVRMLHEAVIVTARLRA